MFGLKAMNPRLTDWRDKRVWLVGGSTGMGAELAEVLLAQGARVALSARRAEPLQGLAARYPKNSWVLPLDVCDAPAVLAAANTIETLWRGVDVVIVMAGTYQAMRAQEFSLAATEQVLAVNLHGPYHVLAAVLPSMLQRQQGHLVMVGSVAGYSGLPKALAYGPSKAALMNLCESLYFDLHPQGIGVTLVSPGFVATPLTAQNDFTMPALLTPQQAVQALLQGLAQGEFEVHFPKRFTRALKLLRLLPYRAYFWLTHRATGL